MYQRTRLYELSVSTKLLLTGFVVATCAAGLLGGAAFYYACKDVDGDPEIAFSDLKIFARGSTLSALERAANRPDQYGLASAGTLDLELLRKWCQAGAPRSGFPEVQRILRGSMFDRPAPPPSDRVPDDRARANAEYKALASLARVHEPAEPWQLAAGVGAYLSAVSLAFLGMGLMFVQTSLFEKTKVFFVSSTCAVAAACPIFLWLSRSHTVYLYPMLLSALLAAVGFGVFALVALYDLWFHRPVA